MIDLFMETVIQGEKDESKCQNTVTGTNNNGVTGDTFECEQCHEIFPTLTTKRKHERFYHFFKKPFVCECGQQFGKLSEVNYHIRRVHNKEKNYICHICKKAFFKNSDLLIHQSIHESSAKFICEDCGRRFKHVSNLIRHSRTHTGIKPYLCLPCNKRFSQVAALRQHEITEKHKDKVAEKNIEEKSTSVINDSLNHKEHQLHDKGNSASLKKNSKEKRKWWFYCKICGERFPFSVLLRDHETKHIANKDIRCNSCKAEFSSIKDFNNHACSVSSKVLQLEKKTVNGGTVEIQEEKNVKDKITDEKYFLDGYEDILNEQDKKVELTLTQNGQIMLDNDEVLLTLNDKVYGLLLINNDVTVVENDEYLQILNNAKGQDVLEAGPDLMDVANEFNIHNLQNDINQGDENEGVNRLIASPDSWLWTGKNLTEGVTEKTGNVPKVEKITKDGIVCNQKKKNKHVHNCTECDKEFDKKGNYLQHLGTHFAKFQKHKCPECTKNFKWNSSLRNHINKKHNKTEFSCLSCGKTYFSNLLVQHHVRRDHLNIRSHKCTFCEKAFFRRYDLKVHIRIHTDERPYICGVCGKRFRHLSHSIRHERIHSKDAKPDIK